MSQDMKERVAYLRSPKAIREQCEDLLAKAEEGKLEHFRVVPEKLDDVAKLVLDVTRKAYPTLDVPYHSRWRHFDEPRLQRLGEALDGKSFEDQARSRIELAIVSVLLDAGAGMKWRYKDEATGETLSKSEGLAVASAEMFLSGAFSSDPEAPAMADAAGLAAVGRRDLANGFQVSAENPLVGLDGRLALLHKLGTAVETHPKIFGDLSPRLGNLYDYLESHAGNGKLPARKILSTVLEAFGGIWPGRVTLAGVNLGDVWPHPALDQQGPGGGYVPFHKLSQWLTYSLVEPLEEAGLEVGGLDELTGLAEYRNGGLFVDGGVLVPKHKEVTEEAHKPDSAVIVEWRACTVALLDRTAAAIRAGLGKSALELPLAKVLQGGTWTAGRMLAAEKRADGGPPIRLASDGTVF